MAIPNDSTRAKPTESPIEPFKRAVAGCVRAIAGAPDLEVDFAADRAVDHGIFTRFAEREIIGVEFAR